MSKRKYRSKREWESLVEDYRSNYSNISKSSYCMKRGISATTFCKWCKHFPEVKENSNFVELSLKPKTGYLKLFGLRLVKFELNV